MWFSAVIGTLALAATAHSAEDALNWVGIWTASPQLSLDAPPQAVTTSQGYFHDTTIRQTLHLTLATDQVRVVLSNEFGTSPLEITASTVALTAGNKAGSDGINTGTLQKLLYGGKPTVTIPAGSTATSDPVKITTQVYQELTTSLYLAKGQIGKNTTAHDKAHTSTFFGPGDQTTKPNIQGGGSAPSWYYVTEIQGQLPTSASAMVCVGDSITDGTGSTMNANNRWVDDLFKRAQGNAASKNVAVLNAGIGGNHLVTTPGNGPTAVQRIKSIIRQPGVRYILMLDGVNDIGHAATTKEAQDALYTQMVNALEGIITEVHAAGIAIFAGTLTPSFVDSPSNPDKSSYANPLRAATRDRLNDWIKKEAKFDYVVDFGAAVAEPSNPDQFQARYAFANYIHPNVAGHQQMADAFDLSAFQKFSNRTSS